MGHDFYRGQLPPATDNALEAVGVEANLGHHPTIPQQYGNHLAITTFELRISIHIHPLVAETMARQDFVEEHFHLVTEMAPRPGEQFEAAHSHSMVAGGLLVTS